MLKVEVSRDSLDKSNQAMISLTREFEHQSVVSVSKAAKHLLENIRHEIIQWTSKTTYWKTGKLVRSFKVGPVLKSGKIQDIKVSSDREYASIHETGGIIRPVRAKMLAIPLRPTARKMKPRDVPGLVLIRSKSNDLLLAKVLGKDRINPWYVLVKQSKITPKRYLTKAVKAARPGIREIFNRAIANALKNVAKR